MRSLLRQIGFLAPTLFILLVITVHAQSSGCPGGTGCFQGPTGNVSIQGFLAEVLQALVKISLPIITVFIVYSGFLFVTAQGRAAQLETAKRNFFFVVLGALLILSAWVLAKIIGGTVTQLLS
ncbi:MAG TPA: hypothetical protein VMU13_01440 [Candidatus Paceibacterota bacterium]|nr:hypothetical protein [Candidatus Paceibacterota bacterium]